MTQKVNFRKMHGAGNDFVMIDGRELKGQSLSQPQIAALCHRRTGIGADGLILIAPAQSDADFRMIYFNADGAEAEMCGNGARCSVAFARDLGFMDEACRFETFSGTLTGTIKNDGTVEVSLPPWRDLNLKLGLDATLWSEHASCNTGVPHVIISVPDVDTVDVQTWGAKIRHDKLFQPAGTNVNWISPEPDTDAWLLRTYERGVEDETLACGTGASAAAVVLCHQNMCESPVTLKTRGGHKLIVSVNKDTGTLLLRGPATTSFYGEVLIDD